MPASKDTRVRVDGLLKMSATVRPASGVAARGRFGVVVHAHPDIGVDGIGARDRLMHVLGDQGRCGRLQRELRGRGDADLDAGQGAEQRE